MTRQQPACHARTPQARRPGAPGLRSATALAIAAAFGSGTAQAQASATPTVEVIGTSPLPGQGIDRSLLPYSTQVIRRDTLDQAQADTLTDFMARRLPGAQVNEIQGSPFQGDLTFRGYRASGLLGASQGLSVYLDGVRVNEPFGDVVNWDLIPNFSVDSLSLVPGANPAFGLNSLGGAVSLVTASGLTAPGWRGEATVGSFGRKQLDLSYGRRYDSGWHAYVALGGFDEDGWRDESEGHLGHVTAKLGRSFGSGDLTFSLLSGRSNLIGNGLVPLYTFDDDGNRTPDLGSNQREAVYTHPDQTRNRINQFSAQWRQAIDDHTVLELLAHVRDAKRETINGDEAEEEEDEDEGGVDETRAPVRAAQAPRVRPRAVDPDAEPNASFNRTATTQRSGGLAAALSGTTGPHQWQVGASVDRATVTYEQTEQTGTFDASRGVLPLGDEAELSADVDGSSTQAGLYATDTWQIGPRTHLTGTLRFNWAKVSNQLTTRDDDTDLLEAKPEETFTYRSWNPALGIAHRLEAGPTLFINAARNNRVPTVIELGCADPEEPCRLPSGLQADPYLKQVVSTTVETGLRFGNPRGTRGSVAFFRTDNRDDILFRSVSIAGQLGYFENFERTRHQGLDAELATRVQTAFGAFDLGAAYSHLDATYQASGTLRVGERNVQVESGTRMAGLPRHMLKLSADWTAGGGFSAGADVQALSGRTVAGNEDGLAEDGGTERIDFSLPGYAVVNLRAAYAPPSLKGVEFYARVTNLFDKTYASFGAVAETLFDDQGAYTGSENDAVFVAPGAPRAFYVGMRVRF